MLNLNYDLLSSHQLDRTLDVQFLNTFQRSICLSLHHYFLEIQKSHWLGGHNTLVFF